MAALTGQTGTNFRIYAVEGALFSIALVFISYESVLPVFLARLGASAAAIAAVPVAIALGSNLPGLLVARRVQMLPRKKPFIILVGLGQRFPWVVVGLATPMLAGPAPHALIVIVLGCLLAVMVASGVLMPAFYDLIATTVPRDRRGLLMTLRSGISYLLGIAGGFAVRFILQRVAYPVNYALLYGIASLFFGANLLLFSRIREPDREAPVVATRARHLLDEALAMLRDDPGFGWYVAAKALFVLAYSATALFPVYLVDRFALADSASGGFVIIAGLTYLVINPVLGYLGDRHGYRGVLVVGAVAFLAAAAAGLGSASILPALSLIVFASVGRTVNLLTWNMAIDFAPEGRVPMYIGVSGALVGVVSPLGLGAGILADRFGYDALFWTTGLFALAGLLVLVFRVPEPRLTRRRRIGRVLPRYVRRPTQQHRHTIQSTRSDEEEVL